MCFSATGSFIAAAINAAAGVATFQKTSGTSESALSVFPLTFAVQQTVEGVLWLEIPVHTPPETLAPLANAFVLLALVVWPVVVPSVAFLVEKSRGRSMLFVALLALGLVFSSYAMMQILSHPYGAQIAGHTIVYSNGVTFPYFALLVYCACVSVPLLASSQGSLKLLGLCVLIGLTVSYVLFVYALLSVWCFFAAVASGLVFFRAYVEIPRVARQAA